MNETPRVAPNVDPKALRDGLALRDPADVHSSEFLRFVIRLSEALNVELPEQDYSRLVTLSGCLDYLSCRELPGR